jgi:hypothetical protein
VGLTDFILDVVDEERVNLLITKLPQTWAILYRNALNQENRSNASKVLPTRLPLLNRKAYVYGDALTGDDLWPTLHLALIHLTFSK